MKQVEILVNAALKFFPIVLFFSSAFSHLTGDATSVYIFNELGWEPAGRYIIGFMEAAAGFLMILPGRSLEAGLVGTVMALGMVGAHLLVLGTELNGDDGWRFGLALILLTSCVGLVIVHRREIKNLPAKLRSISFRNIKMP